jgi:disulfide oxidoreductase YuzD
VRVNRIEKSSVAMKIKWLNKPQKHDYPAAASYLSLSMDEVAAKNAAEELQNAEMSAFAAKDIFRESGLSLLGVSDSHVQKDRDAIIREEKLSPLLLYRDKTHSRLIIADGYHRLCAVYKFDEDAIIPCKIV